MNKEYLCIGRAQPDTIAYSVLDTGSSDSMGVIRDEIGGVAARVALAISNASNDDDVSLIAPVNMTVPDGEDINLKLEVGGVNLTPMQCEKNGRYVAVENDEGVITAVSKPAEFSGHPVEYIDYSAVRPDIVVTDTSYKDPALLLEHLDGSYDLAVVCTNEGTTYRMLEFANVPNVSIHLNLDEANSLGGSFRFRSSRAAVEHLLTTGYNHVTVTDGNRSVAAGITGRDVFEVEPYQLEHVTRTIGAGDAFAGTYIEAFYGRGYDVRQATLRGVMAAQNLCLGEYH